MYSRMQYIKMAIFCGSLCLMPFFSPLVSGEDRNVPVDRAVGGMEEGSRIQSPGSYSNNGVASGKPGSTANSVHDAHTVSQESTNTAAGSHDKHISGAGNRGFIYDNRQVSNPQNEANQGGAEQPGGQVSMGTGGAAQAEADSDSLDAGSQTGQAGAGASAGTGEISTGIGGPGTSAEESSGTSTNPIIDVDADVNPESGTVETGAAIDTSGELEERQILDADLTGETTGSVGAEVGSATDITGADLVEEADITTELLTDAAGQTSTEQTSGSGISAEESSGPSSNPIVDLDASINPESGSIDASIGLDTSGELEDRQVLETDLAAEGIASTETDIVSASDITGSEAVAGLDITTESAESLIPAPADLSAEIDTTGQTVGSEADIGIAANVGGTSEGEDAASDPADGLTTSISGL